MPLNPIEKLGREIADQHANSIVEAWQIETFFESAKIDAKSDEENADEEE